MITGLCDHLLQSSFVQITCPHKRVVKVSCNPFGKDLCVRWTTMFLFWKWGWPVLKYTSLNTVGCTSNPNVHLLRLLLCIFIESQPFSTVTPPGSKFTFRHRWYQNEPLDLLSNTPLNGTLFWSNLWGIWKFLPQAMNCVRISQP